jgi:hypothetical protein
MNRGMSNVKEVDVDVRGDARPVGAVARSFVHLGLIVAAAVSLVFETVLTIHIVVGLAFVALVGAHLLQRRRVSATLAGRLLRVRGWGLPAGRLAVADALLAALTIGMLASGLWDWKIGHPTRIRWHAISGVVLAGFLLVHTLRRRARLRRSGIRWRPTNACSFGELAGAFRCETFLTALSDFRSMDTKYEGHGVPLSGKTTA